MVLFILLLYKIIVFSHPISIIGRQVLIQTCGSLYQRGTLGKIRGDPPEARGKKIRSTPVMVGRKNGASRKQLYGDMKRRY
jgi:hypothetical protein